MSQELSVFIRKEVEKRGLSERELSRAAKLSTTAVHHIINRPDSKPAFETCIALAKALEIPEAVILSLAGYSEINLSEEIDTEITAFAVYLNNLPQSTRAYTLDACWSVARIIAQVASDQIPES